MGFRFRALKCPLDSPSSRHCYAHCQSDSPANSIDPMCSASKNAKIFSSGQGESRHGNGSEGYRVRFKRTLQCLRSLRGSIRSSRTVREILFEMQRGRGRRNFAHDRDRRRDTGRHEYQRIGLRIYNGQQPHAGPRAIRRTWKFLNSTSSSHLAGVGATLRRLFLLCESSAFSASLRYIFFASAYIHGELTLPRSLNLRYAVAAIS